LALIIGVPLGVGAAIFLAELAPLRVSDGLAFIIELLAAVPSVIYGLLAIFTLVPFLRDYVAPVLQGTLGFLPIFKGQSYGVSLMAGGAILAIMILPFIISISREVLLAVPREQREASLALGATQWETTWNVVVPYAKAGIIGSIFLALARALGETMAVTMVIGNDPRINLSLLAPGYSIAAAIANEFTEATSDMHISALIELGFVLFCITIVVNAIARLLILTTTRKSGVA
jgi:phosphate transport system permease protein